MIKPDIIVSWPRNNDYPLWRNFIRAHRSYFNEIIVAFTETHQGEDYRQFVRTAMHPDYVHFLEPQEVTAGQDWRNVAINAALLHSYNAEWVWFTEQDFFIENPDNFFTVVTQMSADEGQWAAVYEGPRMHPCCVFIRRPMLTALDKDFSARPPAYDHFGRIQQQLESAGHRQEFTKGYYHMAGLSHNWTLLSRGEEPNYKVPEFKTYLTRCLALSLPLDDRFVSVARAYLLR